MNGKIPINKQTNNFFVMETDKINEALEVMPSSPLSGKRGLMKDEFCAEISIYCIRINPSQSDKYRETLLMKDKMKSEISKYYKDKR